MNKLLYTVWFSVLTNFAPSGRELLEAYSPEQIYSFSKEELLEIGVDENRAQKLSDKSLFRAERILNICKHSSITPVPFYDEHFPKSLSACPDAPLVVYVKGDLTPLNSDALKVGLVGTRDTTVTGSEYSKQLAKELAEEGVILISGGARGTDSYPLIASVEKGLYCVAVLGCDINRYFPAEHYSLFQCVARCGCVISEYPPETNARFFPSRNRIIAALGDRLAVTEAPRDSGALISAEYAAKYNKPVFALDCEGENFEGCRELIRRGAHPLTSSSEIINNSVPTPFSKVQRKREKTLVKKEIKPVLKPVPEFSDPVLSHVYSCILNGLDTVEKMTDKERCPSDVLCALSVLEIEGKITALPGGRYKLL